MNARESAAHACSFPSDDEPEDVVREGAGFSVGAYLSSQRRMRGLSLDELEASTRIPRRSLARLEAGAFDRQQDAFVRGFVRTVAGAIGVDPSDTLVRMVEPDPVRTRRRRAPPWKAAGAGLLAVLLLSACAGLLLGQGGEGAAPSVRVTAPPPEPEVSIRRDPVRLLAERVRDAAPGTFARPQPLSPPPAMYLAPAPRLALDAVFPRPGAGRAELPAVSAGPG